MSQFELNPDLDMRLRESINNQDDFLANLGFVLALLNEPLIAPNPLFSIDVFEHKAVPVFTTESDLEIFLTDIEMPEGVVWNAVPIAAFWPTLMETEIDSIGFNPKTASDVETGNLYYYDKVKFNEFIQSHADTMNEVMTEANQKTSFDQKSYFIPTFIGSRMYGDIVRVFQTIKAPDEKEYVPIFDNLLSFSRWYRNEDMVKYFKENDGQVRAMTLHDLVRPSLGENRLGDAIGVVINPMDSNPKEDQSNLHLWDELEKLL
jgi:hypothetical protein